MKGNAWAVAAEQTKDFLTEEFAAGLAAVAFVRRAFAAFRKMGEDVGRPFPEALAEKFEEITDPVEQSGVAYFLIRRFRELLEDGHIDNAKMEEELRQLNRRYRPAAEAQRTDPAPAVTETTPPAPVVAQPAPPPPTEVEAVPANCELTTHRGGFSDNAS